MRRLLIAASIALVTATAGAATIAGVTIPDTTEINGRKLVLNGAGLRKKFFVKVYTGALYLPARQSNPAAILAADTPWQTTMRFLYDVDKAKIVEAWTEGLVNTPNATPEVRKAFHTLGSWMEDMKDGQSIVITYVPGSGSTVVVNGKTKGTLPGKTVGDAILSTWIGPKPGPGEDFKNAVLGR